MRRIELAEGIIQYVFEPEANGLIGCNILALYDDRRVALIDTAYERHIVQVLKDLKERAEVIDRIILSHFHNDHIYGLKALPKLPVYGSKHYNITLDKYIEKEEHKYFTPTTLVDSTLELSFGEHKLTLIPYPGHSYCGLLVIIDDKFVHIGDELIAANDGRAALPCVSKELLKTHKEALCKLLEYSKYTLIPSHGRTISGADRIKDELGNRIAYLDAVLDSDEKITVEEATKNCSCEFLCKHWHEFNYR